VANIRKIIDSTIQAVFARITNLTPKYDCNYLQKIQITEKLHCSQS
jgi:hypothetical protein